MLEQGVAYMRDANYCKLLIMGWVISNGTFPSLGNRMVGSRRSFCGSKETYTESLISLDACLVTSANLQLWLQVNKHKDSVSISTKNSISWQDPDKDEGQSMSLAYQRVSDKVI